jgi:2-polyprenyl-3-methyl-5-hydroxy-6-metoxy-1,4-benzoquinol methylase
MTHDYFSSVRTEIGPLLPDSIGNVLEIGCATGGTMAWLKATKHVSYAAGVELMEAAAQKARTVFDAVEFGPIDEVSLDFPVSRFDMILALDVLEHLPNPDRTLDRLMAHLSPGGLLITSIPNVGNFSVAWPLFFRGDWNYADEGALDRTHLRFFSRQSAIALIEGAGLKIERIETTKRYPNLFHPFGFRGKTAKWYSQRLMRLLKLPNFISDSQYLIAARLPSLSI